MNTNIQPATPKMATIEIDYNSVVPINSAGRLEKNGREGIKRVSGITILEIFKAPPGNEDGAWIPGVDFLSKVPNDPPRADIFLCWHLQKNPDLIPVEMKRLALENPQTFFFFFGSH
jgi:hypothetical protein